MVAGIIYLSVLGIGVVAGIVSGVIRYRHQKKYPPTNQYIEKELPIVSETAAVDSKRIEKQMTGSYYEPGHRILYMVNFKKADGKLQSFAVKGDDYKGLNICDSGTLVHQGDVFLNFLHGFKSME